MLLSSWLLAAGAFFTSTTLAANSTTATNSTIPRVLFSASDNSIKFALSVDTVANDLYFSFAGLGDGSWIAVGIGSDHMDDKALMLIAYPASNGKNVTVSTRRTTGHTEPSYNSNYTVELFDGSGIISNDLYAIGRIRGCGNLWAGNTSLIYAYGPGPVSNGDSLTADLRFHSTYGVFSIDLQRAQGIGGVPSLSGPDVGSMETSSHTKTEFSAPFHACIMVFTFVAVLPFGLILVRVLGLTRWHGVNQIFATVLALAGMSCGIYAGTLYNRSRKFNSAHQIFGFLIIIAMLTQLVFGIMNHRNYKQTQSPSKLAPLHVWLGRFVIIGGIANGFAGFPLALATYYNYALLALVLLVGFPLIGLMWCASRRAAKKACKVAAGVEPDSPKLFAAAAPQAFGWSAQAENEFALGAVGSREHMQHGVEPWRGV